MMVQSKVIAGLKSQASPGLKFWMGVLFVLVVLGIIYLLYEITVQQYKIKRYVATEAKRGCPDYR
jgi:hypothetical protein